MIYRFTGKLLGITNDDNLIVYPIDSVKFLPLSGKNECLSFTLERIDNGKKFLIVYLGNEIAIPKTMPITLNLGSDYVFELVYRNEESEYTIKNLYTISLEENKFSLTKFPLMLDTVRYAKKN